LLGTADIGQENADRGAQSFGLLTEFVGCCQNVELRGAGALDALIGDR